MKEASARLGAQYLLGAIRVVAEDQPGDWELLLDSPGVKELVHGLVARLDGLTEPTLPEEANEDWRAAFDAMKAAESEAYAAQKRASKARSDWESACTSRALKDCPQLVGLTNKVEQLETALTIAKAAVKDAAASAGREHLFNRWIR